jgi:glycosyltransferase involved in cell wall biosynthesis
MMIKSYIGHYLRESLIHIKRIYKSHKSPSVMILSSMHGSGLSGDLRGSALAKELERLGWRTIFVPSQLELRQRQRLLRLEKPDVIMMQQSRHPYNLPKYYPGYPIVFDVDDADIYDPKCTNKVIECCHGSVAVTVGNRFLSELLREYNPNVHVIWTGSYLPINWTKKWSNADGRVVSWANSGASVKSAESDFIQAVLCLLAKTTDFEFRIYGVESQKTAETNFSDLKKMKIKIQSHKLMSYKKLARHLRSSDVGLAPICEEVPFSRGKSFGKVLAYLTAKVPVVASDAVDYPLFFNNGENGMVIRNDIKKWADSIRKLLEDPTYRQSLVEKATISFQQRLTIKKSAELFDGVLKKAINRV